MKEFLFDIIMILYIRLNTKNKFNRNYFIQLELQLIITDKKQTIGDTNLMFVEGAFRQNFFADHSTPILSTKQSRTAVFFNLYLTISLIVYQHSRLIMISHFKI